MTEAAVSLPAGYRLHRHDTIGSTNDEAKRLARAGAPEGMLVWAGEQTAGRGRRGRQWASPPGNLYVSFILRPGGTPGRAAQLGFVAALALGEALNRLAGTEARLRCKWPNDLLLDGRKLAGILLESETTASGAVDFVVIGIGVNLASSPAASEYPATSLAEEGVTIGPALLLEAMVREFDLWLARWRQEGFAPVREAWLARASGIGDAIRVRLERITLTGRFVDLDESGALLLDAADGRRRVAAGDVFPALG